MTDLNITKLSMLRFHSSGRHFMVIRNHTRSFECAKLISSGRKLNIWHSKWFRIIFALIRRAHAFIICSLEILDLEQPQLIEQPILVLNINIRICIIHDFFNYLWRKTQSWYPLYDFSWISRNSLILFSTEFSCQIKLWSWEWLKWSNVAKNKAE